MDISPSSQVRPAPNVLVRVVQGEAVVLDLNAERYLGFNAVGTRIWEVLTEAATIDDAIAALLEEFEVTEAQLRADVVAFVQKLLDAGLATVTDVARP